uniref:Uncharacterized protein n=1 Tax=Meloidogyne hapla TaxID=6305 RepID=A0A1I8BFL0_MELHA
MDNSDVNEYSCESSCWNSYGNVCPGRCLNLKDEQLELNCWQDFCIICGEQFGNVNSNVGEGSTSNSQHNVESNWDWVEGESSAQPSSNSFQVYDNILKQLVAEFLNGNYFAYFIKYFLCVIKSNTKDFIALICGGVV